MSATRLLSLEQSSLYKTTGTPTSHFTNSSILKFDKSQYFKNIRHSDIISSKIFSAPYNCPKRTFRYCYYYSLCIIFLSLLAAVTFGGYRVMQLGIIRDEYGHSFNINGTCLCTQNIKTSYDWQQTWKIYNLTVCDAVRDPDFTFKSQSGSRWVEQGDIRPCYTNNECTRIFTSLTTNVIIDEAIYLYVGAVLIILVAICGCIGSAIYLNTLQEKLEIKNILYFVGSKDIKTHFESQWNRMSAKERFDYWISYETRRLNIFLGSDSICELLLQFYDDDDDNNNDHDDNQPKKSPASHKRRKWRSL